MWVNSGRFVGSIFCCRRPRLSLSVLRCNTTPQSQQSILHGCVLEQRTHNDRYLNTEHISTRPSSDARHASGCRGRTLDLSFIFTFMSKTPAPNLKAPGTTQASTSYVYMIDASPRKSTALYSGPHGLWHSSHSLFCHHRLIFHNSLICKHDNGTHTSVGGTSPITAAAKH